MCRNIDSDYNSPLRPSLSVIVPIYNVAEYLVECIDSILRQTFRDFELICVDDGSTDNSKEILERFAADDSRIKIISQANRGVSEARNRALDVAVGEWVTFVDGDDTIEDYWFDRMMRYAKADVDIVHADYFYCILKRRAKAKTASLFFLYEGWPFLNFVRRSSIEDVRFPKGVRIKEDVVFFTELALKTEKILRVEEAGYNYRQRPGSALNQYMRDSDCVSFWNEMSKLRLSREEFGASIGRDLIIWVKDRDWHGQYAADQCRVLKIWRENVQCGKLRISDVRWWWRLGLWVWLKTGKIWMFRFTMYLRLKIGMLNCRRCI